MINHHIYLYTITVYAESCQLNARTTADSTEFHSSWLRFFFYLFIVPPSTSSTFGFQTIVVVFATLYIVIEIGVIIFYVAFKMLTA